MLGYININKMESNKKRSARLVELADSSKEGLMLGIIASQIHCSRCEGVEPFEDTDKVFKYIKELSVSSNINRIVLFKALKKALNKTEKLALLARELKSSESTEFLGSCVETLICAIDLEESQIGYFTKRALENINAIDGIDKELIEFIEEIVLG